MPEITSPTRTIITNQSTLSPNKFKVVINLFPDLSFWAQSFILPTITLGQTLVHTNTTVDYFTPGDKLVYDDLIISFIVDEDMNSYRKIKQWQKNCVRIENPDQRFSDLQILLLTNNSTSNLAFKFQNTWPQTVPSIPMDASRSEDQPLIANVTFKLSSFDVEPEIAI